MYFLLLQWKYLNYHTGAAWAIKSFKTAILYTVPPLILNEKHPSVEFGPGEQKDS